MGVLSPRLCKTGFTSVFVHYSADPAKDADWVAREKPKMGDPIKWEREMEGNPYAAGGRPVYPMWDAAVHEVKLAVLPPIGWTRYRALDHGLANPTVCLWAAVDPDNGVWIYREYYQAERVINENVKAILALEQVDNAVLLAAQPAEKRSEAMNALRPRMSWCDPTLVQRSPSDGVALSDYYAKAGLLLAPGNNQLGVDPVVTALVAALAKHSIKTGKRHKWLEGATDADVAEMAKKQALYFSTACVNTIREHKNWRMDEYRKSENHNLKERPVDKDDHSTDAARYLMAGQPRYRTVVPTRATYERVSRMKKARV